MVYVNKCLTAIKYLGVNKNKGGTYEIFVNE